MKRFKYILAFSLLLLLSSILYAEEAREGWMPASLRITEGERKPSIVKNFETWDRDEGTIIAVTSELREVGGISFVKVIYSPTPEQLSSEAGRPPGVSYQEWEKHLERKYEKERKKQQQTERDKRTQRIMATDWPIDIKNVVINRQITAGMTPEQVITSWGKPERINRSVHPYLNYVSEQWVYGDRTYLYFDNGKLNSWQDSR